MAEDYFGRPLDFDMSNPFPTWPDEEDEPRPRPRPGDIFYPPPDFPLIYDPPAMFGQRAQPLPVPAAAAQPPQPLAWRDRRRARRRARDEDIVPVDAPPAKKIALPVLAFPMPPDTKRRVVVVEQWTFNSILTEARFA